MLDDEGRMTVLGAFYCTLVTVFCIVVVVGLVETLAGRPPWREKSPSPAREANPCVKVPDLQK